MTATVEVRPSRPSERGLLNTAPPKRAPTAKPERSREVQRCLDASSRAYRPRGGRTVSLGSGSGGGGQVSSASVYVSWRHDSY